MYLSKGPTRNINVLLHTNCQELRRSNVRNTFRAINYQLTPMDQQGMRATDQLHTQMKLHYVQIVISLLHPPCKAADILHNARTSSTDPDSLFHPKTLT